MNYVNQQFLEILDHAFNTNYKMILIWFFNNEWIEWIIKYVLFDGINDIRDKLSIAITKYDTSLFVMKHIHHSKLLKYLLEIICILIVIKMTNTDWFDTTFIF